MTSNPKENSSVGIVGAGLAGLTCAKILSQKGYEVSLFEKSNSIGGRLQTDNVDGFLLDRGFQVYLPSYPAGRRHLSYKNLNLKLFGVGAYIKRRPSDFSCFSDPLRNPRAIFKVLYSDVGTLKDKSLLLKLRIQAKGLSKKLQQKDISSLDFLKSYGFSQKLITHFFKPFFSGVFLDDELKLPAHYLLFLFTQFSNSRAALPSGGMNALAMNLQDLSRDLKIYKNTGVQEISGKQVICKDSTYSFNFTVDARPETELKEAYHPVHTFYFKTKSTKWKSKYLYLCGPHRKFVNHVACITGVAPNYAPRGWQLFSVNVVGENCPSVEEVQTDLATWFGKEEVGAWTFIRKYSVEKALPKAVSFGRLEVESAGVYRCGDYMESPSINGAIVSGEKCAQAVMNQK